VFTAGELKGGAVTQGVGNSSSTRGGRGGGKKTCRGRCRLCGRAHRAQPRKEGVKCSARCQGGGSTAHAGVPGDGGWGSRGVASENRPRSHSPTRVVHLSRQQGPPKTRIQSRAKAEFVLTERGGRKGRQSETKLGAIPHTPHKEGYAAQSEAEPKTHARGAKQASTVQARTTRGQVHSSTSGGPKPYRPRAEQDRTTRIVDR
jgi:hypothetical protein